MKLVAIMSLDTCRADIHALLRERKVEVFSELDIEGYHQSSGAGASPAWFGGSPTATDSTLTWAFLEEQQADVLLDAVADFNESNDPDRPVRAFAINVERSV